MYSSPDPRCPRPGIRCRTRATLVALAMGALLLVACNEDPVSLGQPGEVAAGDTVEIPNLGGLRFVVPEDRFIHQSAVFVVEGGIPGAGMTDAERSLRLHLEAAREARLATASRMTEAEWSLRLHQEAAREVSGR